MKSLQNLKQPNRVQSKGVIVMSERFKTQKATQALIQADLAQYPLIIISRKFASSDGHEPGYLCVGQNTITFVGPDMKTAISSHPLAFIESYTADIHNPKIFTYTLVRKHALSLIKKDELLSFCFLADSEEKVKTIISHLDRFVVLSARGKTEKEDGTDITFLDPSRAEAIHADPEIRIEGERFAVDRSRISAEHVELLEKEKTIPCVAIFHPRGLLLLEDGAELKHRGVMESYSFKLVESFGATGPDCFGFKYREFYICLYTEESAHLMNTLAMRKLKAWEGGVEPPELPIAYHPH
jgi:hypothetical protein